MLSTFINFSMSSECKNPLEQFLDWVATYLAAKDPGTSVSVDFLSKLISDWEAANTYGSSGDADSSKWIINLTDSSVANITVNESGNSKVCVGKLLQTVTDNFTAFAEHAYLVDSSAKDILGTLSTFGALPGNTLRIFHKVPGGHILTISGSNVGDIVNDDVDNWQFFFDGTSWILL